MKKVEYPVTCDLCGTQYFKGCLFSVWAKENRGDQDGWVCVSCISRLVRAQSERDGIEVDYTVVYDSTERRFK